MFGVGTVVRKTNAQDNPVRGENMDNEKQQAEHLGSSDCSSRVSATRAKRCVTHYYGCDCREYRYARMRQALIQIMIWAEHDTISGEARQKAMADIAKACHEGLED